MAGMCRLAILTFAASILAGASGPAGAATPREVKKIVAAEAADTAVPPSLALAVANVESGFHADRESPEGARGVMQITPEVARAHGVDPQGLWDARTNVRLGLGILGDLFRASSHRWPAALERYAAAIPGGEEGQAFARRVLGQERRFAEEIVTRNALEQRKREVLNIGRNSGLAAVASPEIRRPAAESVPPRPTSPAPAPVRQLAARGVGDDLDADLHARLAAARRSLDDFASGRIPADLSRGRRSWRGR